MKPESSVYITDRRIDRKILINKKSQSALEYMMTYGWAILIIVIVAAVLYSLGIFNPTSSIPKATVTGFAGLGSVSAFCTSNGVLRISIGDSLGVPIEITQLNGTDSDTGQTATFTPNSTVDPNPIIQPDSSYAFSLSDVCPSAGSSYSIASSFEYTEIGQTFPGPYFSTGTLSGSSASVAVPAFVSQFTSGTSYTQYVTINKEFFQNDTFTILGWIYYTDIPNLKLNNCCTDMGYAWSGSGPTDGGFGIFARGANTTNHAWYVNFLGDDMQSSYGPNEGHWYMLGVQWDKINKSRRILVDGAINWSGVSGGHLITDSPMIIGGPSPWDSIVFENYLISDVQIYNNTWLSSTQISQLYSEGLSGTPLSGVGLDGYWPLNGTAKDYSGNNNNGVATNVIYTSNYQNP